MKNLLYGLILILSCFIPQQKCYSQIKFNTIIKRSDPLSPSTYDLLKMNNIKNINNTGVINHIIPFYSYKDPDFIFDISFNYSSNGYMPNLRTGALGRDWKLCAGGIITREIKGSPDDLITDYAIYSNQYPYQIESFSMPGFYELHNSIYKKTDFIDENRVTTNNTSILLKKHSANGLCFDSQSDEYHFSFNGYSGSFRFLFNKEVIIYNCSTLNRLKIDFVRNISGGFSEIIISTPDGYKYRFGGCDDNYEYDFDHNEGSPSRVIKGWKLNSIVSPNGRYIKYEYSGANDRIVNYLPLGEFYLIGEYNYQMWDASSFFNKSFSLDNHFASNDNSKVTFKHGANELEVREMFSNQISKIIIDNGISITFFYKNTDGEKYFLNSQNSNIDAIPTLILDSIKIHDNNKLIKKCIMNYTYPTININNLNHNKIHFLSKLTVSDIGEFVFNYYDLDKGFPSYGTHSIDHWGYYNGKNNDGIGIFNVCVEQNMRFDEKINTNLKEPDSTFTRFGMLKKIRYPTGGYITMEYEQNIVTSSMERNSRNLFYPKLEIHSDSILTGGLRIKSLNFFNSDNVKVDSKKYQYINENGVCSGIRSEIPKYSAKYIATPLSPNFPMYKYVERITSYNINYPLRSHIEYSHVKEINSDKSFTIYTFSSSRDFPDIIISPFQEFPKKEENIGLYQFKSYSTLGDYTYCNIYSYPEPLDKYALIHSLMPITSNEYFRGDLLNTKYYNNNGKLFKEVTNDFKHNINLKDSTQIILAESIFTKIEFLCSKFLDSVKTINYTHNGSISTTESYLYNKDGQLINTTLSQSDGSKLIKKTKYASDVFEINDLSIIHPEIVSTMINTNCISNPIIEEIIYRDKNNDSLLLKKHKNSYVLLGETNKFIGNLKIESYNTDKQQYEIELENTKFNKYGYVQEQKDRDGKYTSYLWSYNNKFPIIIANNILYQNLQSIISSDPEIANIQNEIPSDLMIDYLHNKIASSSLSATGTFDSYIYNPNLGLLLQKKSSKGVRQYYQYDNFGRLICVRDNNRNVLERYAYHYQNDSAPESLQIPENNIGAKITCMISGNGTLGNNNSLLRVGDAINLGVIFPVTPNQYYEFDGYYVNGVLIPNPGNYIVQGDVQIEARTKEVAGAELRIRLGSCNIIDAGMMFKYMLNGEVWSNYSIVATNDNEKSIFTNVTHYPLKLLLFFDKPLPSLRIFKDGVIIQELLCEIPSGYIYELEFTEFGPHEIVIEIP